MRQHITPEQFRAIPEAQQPIRKRDHAVAMMLRDGVTAVEAARHFGLHTVTVQNWARRQCVPRQNVKPDSQYHAGRASAILEYLRSGFRGQDVQRMLADCMEEIGRRWPPR